ncbi:MAG: alginate export family protein [Limisphaerales bacterium]
MMKTKHPLLTGGALVLAITASVFAQTTPPPPPAEPGSVASLFHGQIPEAFAKGRFNVNVRARYEFVDQDNLADQSNAGTVRTRFGFTTAPVHGFQGMIEAENVTAFDDDSYNAAGSNGQPTRPVVADPETTELNQAWLAYSYTNLATAKVGRQRIVLDNHRFVGDVGWRQNQQTFDAASLTLAPAKGFNIFYGYVWDVNRVFGDVSGLPAANTDFNSSSHLINVAYAGCDYAKLTGYAYLLDLENAAGFASSCATYGLAFTGSAPVSEKLKLDYKAEFALQSDYADNPQSYDTEYYNLELAANVKPFVLGAGYEVLGSDNGVGFKTPLATLHAFNGWADVFLNTPGNGLRDWYVFAQVTLPKEMPLRVVYHKFDADTGGADYGQEVDVVLSRKFGKHWTALVKYAHYFGDDPVSGLPANTDVQKFWAQVEFNF